MDITNIQSLAEMNENEHTSILGKSWIPFSFTRDVRMICERHRANFANNNRKSLVLVLLPPAKLGWG